MTKKQDMQLSAKGLAEIAGSEGIIPMPYLDSKNIWTFGIGHTRSASLPDPSKMTRGKNYGLDMCFEIYIKDMQKYVDRVNRAVEVPLEQHEFDALVSFDYNTGGIFRARLTRLLNEGAPRKQVAQAFMGWLKPITLKGRRTGERDLFYAGVYKHKGKATYQLANHNGRKIRKGSKIVDADKLIQDYLNRTNKQEEVAKESVKEQENIKAKENIKISNKSTLLEKIFDFFKSN